MSYAWTKGWPGFIGIQLIAVFALAALCEMTQSQFVAVISAGLVTTAFFANIAIYLFDELAPRRPMLVNVIVAVILIACVAGLALIRLSTAGSLL